MPADSTTSLICLKKTAIEPRWTLDSGIRIMPRSPDDPVICDSKECLWNVFREGLYVSTEVTASGHWVPEADSAQWAQRVQAESPLGRFSSVRSTLSIVPPSPPPTPSAEPRFPLGEVHINVLRVEVALEERKRSNRAAALRKIEEGVRELRLADEL